MRSRPSRAWSVVLAVLAVAWVSLLLPAQLAAWTRWDATSGWVSDLDRLPAYRSAHAGLAGFGLTDTYLVFGSAASLSFVLLWLATGPVLAALGGHGRALGTLLLAGAPITLLSYLNYPPHAPLHGLWGGELIVLLAIGIWALVVAVPGRPGIPRWERLLLAGTLPVMVVATGVFGYWPHGTLIGLGAEAVVLTAFAPRWSASEPAPASAHTASAVDGPDAPSKG